MDETPRQLIGQTREVIAVCPAQPQREDYEYTRLGTCNVFMACEPLTGQRMTQVSEQRTKHATGYCSSSRSPSATAKLSAARW